MFTARKLTFRLSIALLTMAFFSPAQAVAAEAPTIPELTAEATSTAIAHSKSANALAWVDARLDSTRARLAAAESRLPGGSPGESLALMRAVGAAFSPALADATDTLAADRRQRDAIAAEVEQLDAERTRAAVEFEHARAEADAARSTLEQARIAEAQRIEAERIEAERVAAELLARERAEKAAAYGIFPVAGPNEYIDSWGFARSGGRRHKGTDIMATTGTPVVAVRDGVVTSGSNRLGGLIVWLQADDGTRYYYAHLDSIAIGSGRVTSGQVLGTVGSTGNARGGAAHLHFEIHQAGAVDPYPFLRQMVV